MFCLAGVAGLLLIQASLQASSAFHRSRPLSQSATGTFFKSASRPAYANKKIPSKNWKFFHQQGSLDKFRTLNWKLIKEDYQHLFYNVFYQTA
jgi:hypothetical protein